MEGVPKAQSGPLADGAQAQARSRATSRGANSRSSRNNPYASASVITVESAFGAARITEDSSSHVTTPAADPEFHLTANPEDTTEIVSLFATFDPDAGSSSSQGGLQSQRYGYGGASQTSPPAHAGGTSPRQQPYPSHPYLHLQQQQQHQQYQPYPAHRTGSAANSFYGQNAGVPQAGGLGSSRSHNPYIGAQVVPPSPSVEGGGAGYGASQSPQPAQLPQPMVNRQGSGITAADRSSSGQLFPFAAGGGPPSHNLSRNFGTGPMSCNTNSSSTSQNPLMFNFNAMSGVQGIEGDPLGEPRYSAPLMSSLGNLNNAGAPGTALSASQGDARIITKEIQEDGNITVSVKQKVRTGGPSLSSSFAAGVSQTDVQMMPMPPPSPSRAISQGGGGGSTMFEPHASNSNSNSYYQPSGYYAQDPAQVDVSAGYGGGVAGSQPNYPAPLQLGNFNNAGSGNSNSGFSTPSGHSSRHSNRRAPTGPQLQQPPHQFQGQSQQGGFDAYDTSVGGTSSTAFGAHCDPQQQQQSGPGTGPGVPHHHHHHRHHHMLQPSHHNSAQSYSSGSNNPSPPFNPHAMAQSVPQATVPSAAQGTAPRGAPQWTEQAAHPQPAEGLSSSRKIVSPRPSSRSPRRTPGQSPTCAAAGSSRSRSTSIGQRTPRNTSFGSRGGRQNAKGRSPGSASLRSGRRGGARGGSRNGLLRLRDGPDEMLRADRTRPITGFVDVFSKMEGFRYATSLNLARDLPIGTKVIVEGDRGNLIGEVRAHITLPQMIEDCDRLEEIQPQIEKTVAMRAKTGGINYADTVTAACAMTADLSGSRNSSELFDECNNSTGSAPPPPGSGGLEKDGTQVYKAVSTSSFEKGSAGDSNSRVSDMRTFNCLSNHKRKERLRAMSPAEQQEKLRSVVFAYKDWPWVVDVANEDDLEDLREQRAEEERSFQTAANIVRHYVHRSLMQREEKEKEKEKKTGTDAAGAGAAKGRRKKQEESDSEGDVDAPEDDGTDPNRIRLVDVEYQLNRQKLTLYVSRPASDVFVDFRRMQRKLYRAFRCRIWMAYQDEICEDNDSPQHVEAMVEVQRQKQMQQKAARELREQQQQLGGAEGYESKPAPTTTAGGATAGAEVATPLP